MAVKGNLESKLLYSSCATLAGIGAKLRALELLAPIEQLVKIKQKIVKRSPFEKLQDALITILAGAHGLVEINTRLRSDKALQKAFGRKECAEQSVVQFTLNHCTSENVGQMMKAVDEIFRRHSHTARHDYDKNLLLVDIDLTGLPCGKKSEEALKGYQASLGISYGRQLCRALAADYEEVILDRLYPGNLLMTHVINWMIQDLEETLKLTAERRNRIVIRMDSGGSKHLNDLIKRGYQVHAKESALRANSLGSAVKKWIPDPMNPGLELGWFPLVLLDFAKPVRRLIMRYKKLRSDGFKYASLISTLQPQEVLALLNLPKCLLKNDDEILRAYSKLYNKRAGCVEVEFKESKQGIGINKRQKKSFAGQQMTMLLGQLAHNILVWSRSWFAKIIPKFKKYGALRMIRDLFHITGLLESDDSGKLIRITLNKYSPMAQSMSLILSKLLRTLEIKVRLGVT